MSLLKQIIRRIAYVLLFPVRRAQRRKYGSNAESDVPRIDLPNEAYLPIICRYVAAGESAVFIAKGYSMRPFLEHLRDKVQISPWTDLQVGDAVLAELSKGHFVLHRIIARNGNQLTLRGDGNLHQTESCTTDDVRGIVTKYIRPGDHVLLADDPQLKRNIQRWGRLPAWARRLFLFIYKQTL